MKHVPTLIATALITFAINAIPAFADPHCRPCPYSCESVGLGRKDCRATTNSGGVCCLDLNDKGIEIVEEQERAQGALAKNTQATERCPAGYQPSEQKCSPQERRRGCKDIRLPNGLGCVRR